MYAVSSFLPFRCFNYLKNQEGKMFPIFVWFAFHDIDWNTLPSQNWLFPSFLYLHTRVLFKQDDRPNELSLLGRKKDNDEMFGRMSARDAAFNLANDVSSAVTYTYKHTHKTSQSPTQENRIFFQI